MDSDAEEAEVSKAAAKKYAPICRNAFLTSADACPSAEWAVSKIKEVDIHPWKAGQPVPYAALAHTFSLIEATTKRIEKTALLTSFLLLVIQRSAEDDTRSLLESVYLCINRVRSPPRPIPRLTADLHAAVPRLPGDRARYRRVSPPQGHRRVHRTQLGCNQSRPQEGR